MRNKWEKVKAKVKLVLMVDDDDDQAPSEQDIEDALKILVSRKPELLEDSEGYNRTFRELRNELVPKIDEGITLTDQNSAWKPWLSDMQSSDTWETPRSDSYYQYLVMDKNSSYSTLDYTANEIVKLLADPRRDQPAVSRKGLILGDVQSGKTRTYIALMNKAADCGYRLIIVLTSDNENLRQQTQERIDTDFIGWQDGIRVGIGKYQQNIAHPSQLTNENDFVIFHSKLCTKVASIPSNRTRAPGPSQFMTVPNAPFMNVSSELLTRAMTRAPGFSESSSSVGISDLRTSPVTCATNVISSSFKALSLCMFSSRACALVLQRMMESGSGLTRACCSIQRAPFLSPNLQALRAATKCASLCLIASQSSTSSKFQNAHSLL